MIFQGQYQSYNWFVLAYSKGGKINGLWTADNWSWGCICTRYCGRSALVYERKILCTSFLFLLIIWKQNQRYVIDVYKIVYVAIKQLAVFFLCSALKYALKKTYVCVFLVMGIFRRRRSGKDRFCLRRRNKGEEVGLDCFGRM